MLNNLIFPKLCRSLPNFSSVVTNLPLFADIYTHGSDQMPSVGSVEEYTTLLVPYIECTPARPTTLRRPEAVVYDCNSAHFDGPRTTPKTIIDIFPFSYELDILEMRLFELDEFVDRFVLFESIYTHRVLRKPLFYERNKRRYRLFRDKIYHIIADDAVLGSVYNRSTQKHGDIWTGESIMREIPWNAIKAIMKTADAMKDVLFIHSDLDEIPSATAIAHLKYCKPRFALPTKLAGTVFSHTFEWIRWQDNEHIVVFEYNDAIEYFEDRLPRRNTNMCSYYTDHVGYMLNRFSNAYGDMFKELSMAEGGIIPSHGGQISPAELARSPELSTRWRQKGIRSCCPGDKVYARTTEAVPWFATQNPERFAIYFPNKG